MMIVYFKQKRSTIRSSNYYSSRLISMKSTYKIEKIQNKIYNVESYSTIGI